MYLGIRNIQILKWCKFMPVVLKFDSVLIKEALRNVVVYYNLKKYKVFILLLFDVDHFFRIGTY